MCQTFLVFNSNKAVGFLSCCTAALRCAHYAQPMAAGPHPLAKPVAMNQSGLRMPLGR